MRPFPANTHPGPGNKKPTSRPNVELQSNAVDLQRLCLTVGGVHVASHQRRTASITNADPEKASNRMAMYLFII